MDGTADNVAWPGNAEEWHRVRALRERTAGLSRKVEELKAAASDCASEQPTLSERVAQFIRLHIDSIEELEILLLLAEEPNRRWTQQEILDAIQSSAASIQQRLAKLQGSALLRISLETEAYYSLDMVSGQWKAPLLQELACVYRERRVSVVELIYSKTRGGVSEFARAFRVRE